MKRCILIAAIVVAASGAHAAGAPDFSGRWAFDAARSRNVGTMAEAAIVSTITQNPTSLTVDDHSVYQGHAMDDRTVYDLTGSPAQNVSRMSGSSTTRSKWEGDRLLTEWQTAGAVSGSISTRNETRYLSADRKTMYVKSATSGHAPIVMAFDRTP